MVRPYYNQERGKHKKFPEITQRNWSQWSKTKKRFQKITKDMPTFSIESFNGSIFSLEWSLSFFFLPPNTMDLPVGFPGRQSEPALQQHCSQRNHAYAVQAIHYTLSLQKDIDLQCRAASKAYRTGARQLVVIAREEKHLIKGMQFILLNSIFQGTRESQKVSWATVPLNHNLTPYRRTSLGYPH